MNDLVGRDLFVLRLLDIYIWSKALTQQSTRTRILRIKNEQDGALKFGIFVGHSKRMAFNKERL